MGGPTSRHLVTLVFELLLLLLLLLLLVLQNFRLTYHT
jgi:hypothetical protein